MQTQGEISGRRGEYLIEDIHYRRISNHRGSGYAGFEVYGYVTLPAGERRLVHGFVRAGGFERDWGLVPPGLQQAVLTHPRAEVR